MSDNWITLVPEDATFVPTFEAVTEAERYLAEIAPDADEIASKRFSEIQFFDCGANFERICCPTCKAEVDNEWWQETLDKDYEDGFTLQKNELPCCGAEHDLNELQYEWPQAFGKFALETMNPNIGQLPDTARQLLQNILGTSLRVVYQHI